MERPAVDDSRNLVVAVGLAIQQVVDIVNRY